MLAGDPSILRCHGSYWDARFYGDAGASLAMLKVGSEGSWWGVPGVNR